MAVKELGSDSAEKLKRRYSDLRAARTVGELVHGHPHPLKHDRKGQFALDLAGGKRIVFEPVAPPLPDDDIDWSRVSEVTIVFLGDYHD